MKIGILTFCNSKDNYGQLLQCYALQQQLIKMGHKPFLIEYQPRNKKMVNSFKNKIYKLVLIYPIIKSLISKLEKMRNIRIAKYLNKKNIQRKFDEFRTQCIQSGNIVYYSLEEIQNNAPVADCYICGSDQIWSMLLSNNENRVYYLDFGNKAVKRIAYAASFGNDVYPPKLNGLLYDLLLRFDAVSVREDAGVKICNNIGINACMVLDPTLLLSLPDYQLIVESPNIEKKYFYTYSINVTSSKEICWKELSQYGNNMGLISVSTTSSGYILGREICKDTIYEYATIPQWLGYILNAEFVATTSFHGIAFCIIFKKNFIYFPLKGRYSKGNNRVLSILSTLNLLEKVCWSKKDVERCINFPINWDHVNGKMLKLREESLNFLCTNLFSGKV